MNSKIKHYGKVCIKHYDSGIVELEWLGTDNRRGRLLFKDSPSYELIEKFIGLRFERITD